ncbi:MAG: phenylalanine--tRNA ligase subunit beta [Candidatus Pacebacteria bacterium]|nr:phenylalanine--tRNA ligase subunit beta [Candidatus Paceibacterota bacterium]
MKISYNWLQRHIEEKLPEVEVLKEKIIFHAFEVESVEQYKDDHILDIKVLPDRAHDCLGHAGMAREVAGLLGLTFTSYPLPDLTAQAGLPEKELEMKVEIQSDLCRRYIAVEMSGVKVGPSPDWLKDAIESLGAKSINNVVDATNLVLYDDGQPMHAFDKDKIDGGIVVRLAHEGEQIVTLSKEEKKLSTEDLIIADYLGPLAIAGIKGGLNAEVTEDLPAQAGTKNIIIEVANFEPTTVRKTSKRLSLQTDASKRFENEITPEIALDAARHVVGIIQKVAGGEVVGISDTYKNKIEPKAVTFTLSDITKLLGNTITEADIDLWVSRYNISSKKDEDKYTIAVPSQRLDITGPHDIAEEIGRLVGYDRIPVSELPFKPIASKESEYNATVATKYWLAQNGFREVMNYSFTKKGDVYISYGSKDKSALRSNLSDGLKESYEKNRLNSGLLGLDNIRIFEIGTVFLKDKEEMRVATCDKGTFEELPLLQFIEKYKIDTSKTFNFQLSTFNSFKPWSVYPYITRDIAVWVNNKEDLSAQAGQARLDDIVASFAKKYCVRAPVLFDHFEKDGRTSVAYRLVFQSYEKTLTEAEVESWFAELVETIKKEGVFEIR